MHVWIIGPSMGGLLLLLAVGSGANGQTASPPVLTIEDAVALAMKGNRRILSSELDIHRAAEGTAATKTQRLPQFNIYLLGGGTLQPIKFHDSTRCSRRLSADGPYSCKRVDY